jgi:DNA-binding transcriptional regulator YiaG
VKPKQLKRWREAMDWTQAEAAAALHVPLATYADWEQGRRRIPRPLLPLTCYIQQHGAIPPAALAAWLAALDPDQADP